MEEAGKLGGASYPGLQSPGFSLLENGYQFKVTIDCVCVFYREGHESVGEDTCCFVAYLVFWFCPDCWVWW